MTDYATTITADEGVRHFPYKCSEGKTTIGVGRNLEDVGLSPDEINYIYKNDEKRAIEGAESLIAKFRWLSDNQKIALVSMVFQMGTTGVSKFKNMIAAIDSGNFKEASKQMLDSKWSRQTPERAKRLAEMMKG